MENFPKKSGTIISLLIVGIPIIIEDVFQREISHVSEGLESHYTAFLSTGYISGALGGTSLVLFKTSQA